MSFRSRARRLQRALGVSYQQALAKIRANAEAAAAMARGRGWPLGRCDLELAAAAAPIEVVEIETPEDPIHEICARLAAQTLARAVMLFDRRNWLAGVGQLERADLMVCIVGRHRPQPPTLLALGEGRSVYWAPLDGGRATLSVIFDQSTSLGLVRLRTGRAVAELEPLLAARRRTGGAPPPPARGGPSGAPAEAWLSVAALKKRRS
jgi:hypothetical protein